ncbi:hypothetical protein N7532_004875 [Penicillium argentinense]|uniref:Peptidase M20 dimerisation domain-containing protein n=1 Tax=Penicillium argentinense TaxID=1131581 RepID=A0A9W9K9A8_9EURO|nr:uncharacterized protein N7532_004875 [Penicillium argentinense]KAJ5097874.1 hypothetical protein N7532_004875 [Penicillium argentinense]
MSNLLKHPVVDLHRQICQVESITGNERPVAEVLVSYLEQKGFTVEKQPVPSTYPDERYNVLAYMGETRDTKICLSSHIDVVPPYWPYELVKNNTEIRGRGVVDAKACVAAQIVAAEELWAASLIKPGDISLLFVVGEETEGDGMIHANKLGLSWDAVIFGEPTEGTLPKGHKGVLNMRLTAIGKAAHSGYPALGESAIDKLLSGLNELRQLQLPSSGRFGETTMNIGRINGGVAPNVISFSAEAEIMFRVAGTTIDGLKTMIEDALNKCGNPCTFTYGPDACEPVQIECDVPGFDTMVVSYGTDIPNLNGNHKNYLYGPGSIHVAHTEEESLKVADLVTAVTAYRTLALHALKN